MTLPLRPAYVGAAAYRRVIVAYDTRRRFRLALLFIQPGLERGLGGQWVPRSW